MGSADEMTTTNLRLPRAQLRALKRVAVERDTSLSRLVREIVGEFLACQARPLSPSAYRGDPVFGLGAKPGRSRLGDLAEKHDKYLYDADR